MADPGIGTIQFASTKLDSGYDDFSDMDFYTTSDDDDSDMDMDKDKNKNKPDISPEADISGYSSVDDLLDTDEEEERENELIALDRKQGRKAEADDFRNYDYLYGSSMDEKTIVWDGRTHSLTDKSSGIVWVGVHGTNSICVVTRTGDLDVTRVLDFLKKHSVELVLRKFRRTVISELEDLAMPSREVVHQRLGQRIQKPFGVVSVILDCDMVPKASGHEAFNDEYEEDEVMQVMPEKVESVETSSAESRDMVRKMLWKDDESSRLHSLLTIAGYGKDNTIGFLQHKMLETVFTINETFKASNADYDMSKTTKFLIEKMEASVVDETVRESNAESYVSEATKFLMEKMEACIVDETVRASKSEYDVTDATKFLMERMEASTVDETVKTAISAFQILFHNKKFKAEDIGVSVMDPNYFVTAEESGYKDIYVKHLEVSDINEYLAAINEPGSRGSSSGGSSSEASRGGGSSSEGSRRKGRSFHYLMV